MSRIVAIASCALVLAVLLGTVSTTRAAEPMTVKLEPQNNSGESGTATLTAAGKQTKVSIEITGQPAGVNQPVHIHKGTCDKLDPKPTYPLKPVVNGKSVSTVKASMDDLMTGGFAINGHKSTKDIKDYVFCGNIGGM